MRLEQAGMAVRNPSAYVHRAVNTARRRGAAPPAGGGMGAASATASLDANALTALQELPQQAAAAILDELAAKGGAVRNPSAYVVKAVGNARRGQEMGGGGGGGGGPPPGGGGGYGYGPPPGARGAGVEISPRFADSWLSSLRTRRVVCGRGGAATCRLSCPWHPRREPSVARLAEYPVARLAQNIQSPGSRNIQLVTAAAPRPSDGLLAGTAAARRRTRAEAVTATARRRSAATTSRPQPVRSLRWGRVDAAGFHMSSPRRRSASSRPTPRRLRLAITCRADEPCRGRVFTRGCSLFFYHAGRGPTGSPSSPLDPGASS